MEQKIIGGDLGTIKTGICLISINDDKTKILDSKVIINNFKDEYKYNTKNYKTPSANRRLYRSSRVNRKHKKEKLKLVTTYLCKEFNLNDIKYFSNVLDLKLKGLSSELSLEELACILINYTRYNGYNTLDDDETVVDDVKTKYKKKLLEAKKWCDENSPLTISSYYKYIKDSGGKYRNSDHPVTKELHKQELELILTKQKFFHIEISDNFYKNIINKIYSRRGLKSSRHLISDCEFEYNRKVSPKYLLSTQEYIIWQGIHNLRINDNPIENTEKIKLFEELNRKPSLNKDEILNIILEYRRSNYKLIHPVTNDEDIIYSEITDITNDNVFNFTSSEIRIVKKLLKDGILSDELLNKLFVNKNYKVSHKELTGNRTRFYITEIIGTGLEIIKNKYRGVLDIKQKENEIIENIAHRIYSEPYIFTRKKALAKFNNSQDDIKLSDDNIQSLSMIKLIDGFSDASSKAIKNILPYMNGEIDFLDHHYAIIKAYGDKTSNVEKKSTLEKLKAGSLRNPTVENKVNQFIKLINYYIGKKLVDCHTEVHIEFSRDLMLPKKIRLIIEKNNDTNRKINKEIEELLKFFNSTINSSNVKRIKLWLQQGGKYEIKGKNFLITNDACDLYSNLSIKLSDALNKNLYNIDHIIPESRCFNNTLNNLILTSRSNNSRKNNRTAYEFVEETFTDNEKKIFISNVEKYFGDIKKKKIRFEYGYDNMPDDMGENQLVLNSYISKKITQQLKTYFDSEKIIPVNGVITDHVKNVLGYTEMFKNIIKDNAYKFKKKQVKIEEIDKRFDERNHVLDAIVVAMIDYKIIYRINNLNKIDNKNDISLDNFIKKYAVDFFKSENHIDIVKESLNRTIVNRRKDKYPIFNKTILQNEQKHKIRCVRNSLHDETFYSEFNGVKTINVSLIDFKKEIIKVLNKTKTVKTLETIRKKIDSIIGDTSRNLLESCIHECANPDDTITPDIINVAFNTFITHPSRKNTKNIKIRSFYQNTVPIGKKGYIRNIVPNNNYLLVIYKEKGEYKQECFSLLDYTSGRHKDFLNTHAIKHVFKKRDYFVCGFDRKELKILLDNNNYSFLENTFFIPEMNAVKFYYEPFFSNNEDCFRLGESSNKYFNRNSKVTKIKINDYGEIFL
jgi:CRISPR/Cas system Type II protein with McrA/HNH and RuvC-like nuclease domain